MCSKHYSRNNRYGNANFVKQEKDGPKICTVGNCKRKKKAKGLCEAHYARFKRHGDKFDSGPIRKNIVYGENDVCIVPQCYENPHAVNLCRNHYNQKHKHKLNFFKIIHLFEKGCMICKSFECLSIDHDHNICSEKIACEKCFRGILCGNCNRALGIVGDNKERLMSMIQYLERG